MEGRCADIADNGSGPTAPAMHTRQWSALGMMTSCRARLNPVPIKVTALATLPGMQKQGGPGMFAVRSIRVEEDLGRTNHAN